MTCCAATTEVKNTGRLGGRGRESSSATAKLLFRYFALVPIHIPHCLFVALSIWDDSLRCCRSFTGKNSQLYPEGQPAFHQQSGDGSRVIPSRQGKARAGQTSVPKARLEYVTQYQRFAPGSAAFSRLKQQRKKSSPSKQDT